MTRLSLAVALLFVAACYLSNVYEPAICIQERVDTVLVINDAYYTKYYECEVWRALSDSTKCFANDGEKIPCP